MRAQLQRSFSFLVSLSAHRPRDYVYFGIDATNSGLHYNSKGYAHLLLIQQELTLLNLALIHDLVK
jgi:hypothetical protein